MAVMHIRQLGLDSAFALQRIRELVDSEGTLGRPAERQRALTIEAIEQQIRAPFETVGAFVNDEIVVSAALCRMAESPFDPDLRNWFGLAAVVVHPQFRGRGFGKALLRECLARAEQQGGTGILLEVNTPNPAMALYEALGFEIWNVYEGAYMHEGTRMDTVSMRKRLNVG